MRGRMEVCEGLEGVEEHLIEYYQRRGLLARSELALQGGRFGNGVYGELVRGESPRIPRLRAGGGCARMTVGGVCVTAARFFAAEPPPNDMGE